jgi:hypothetical protein
MATLITRRQFVRHPRMQRYETGLARMKHLLSVTYVDGKIFESNNGLELY